MVHSLFIRKQLLIYDQSTTTATVESESELEFEFESK